MIDEKAAKRIQKIVPILDENQKRMYLAAEAESLGRGGISQISEVLGVSRNTIAAGIKELSGAVERAPAGRIRKEGGGRKSIEQTQPGIMEALESLVSESSYGNPESPLRWTTKSLRNLSDALLAKGFSISFSKVRQMLNDLGYSLQLNQKMLQVGEPHPDRDEQFRHISETAAAFLSEGLPVISIDCKKKELVGNFRNQGAEYAKSGQPVKVLDHDFPLPELGKVAPYGVYDMARNEGFINLGISSDTARFAVNSVRQWWDEMGMARYPGASKLYITADGGGSNGSRNRLWKTELQQLANETGLQFQVSHFPPGTSKWNKIEHQLFSYISKNWRGRPLETLMVIISLVESTTTKKGLKVKCGLDTNEYETGIKVSEEELQRINISRDDFHGEWNYCISPSEVFA
ncbi:MAG: Mobile element protein [Spirochaeta sp.]|jgi:transposase|nr:Mobile element protein [Spirochaeta sp.]